MLALLLTAAMTSPFAQALIPRVEVSFMGGEKVSVQGPEPVADFPAKPAQTLLSPRGDAAAVRFCWDIPKYDSCQVHLVRPDGTVQELKNSNVTRLLWTADGKYLIGAGANTIRLWNLVGGVRAALPRPVLLGKQRSFSHIGRLWLRGSDLCVSMNSEVFGPNGGYATGQQVTTTRYALPTLKPLTVTTLGSTPNEKAKEAECRPSTSSDLWP